MQPVRPLGGPTPPAPRGRLALALAAVVVLAAAALLAQAGRGTVRVSDADFPDPLTDAGGREVDLVYDFNGLVASGDHAAAAEVVADDWSLLALPAMPFRFLPDGADREAVAAALSFYGEVAAPTVIGCRATRSTPTATDVVCDHRLDSAWAEAVHVGGRTSRATYQVADGEILAILADHLGAPAVTDLCHYAEQRVHGSQAPLFDTECTPLATAPAAVHRSAAADFVAAGRPAAGPAYRAARSGATAVPAFVATHNRGGSAGTLVNGDASASGFPGLVSEGLPPRLADFVEWSKVAYRIDPGRCWVDGSRPDATLRLTCGEATWTGPLVEGLALDEVRQPVTFHISESMVQSVGGGTAPGLAHAFGRFCEWVHANRPEVVPSIFGWRCRPIFTADAAGRMLLILDDYDADAR